MPLFSIITVNLNNFLGLRETIQSVLIQEFENYEIIIIDGGSNDGSKEIIEFFKNRISYWITEEDNGIYHAMNKGIVQATGEYLIFLNSGDFLVDKDVLFKVSKVYQDNDLLMGNLALSKNGKVFHIVSLKEEITFKNLYNQNLPHQATFIKRDLFDRFGLYDEDLKIYGDLEFWIRTIIKNNCSVQKLNILISDYNTVGLSSNPETLSIRDAERGTVISQNIPKRILSDYKSNQDHLKSLEAVLWLNSKRYRQLIIKILYLFALQSIAILKSIKKIYHNIDLAIISRIINSSKSYIVQNIIKLIFVLKLHRKKPITILVWHQIGKNFIDGFNNNKDWTSLEDFESSINYLLQKKFVFISLKEACDILASARVRRHKYVVITIDDGYSTVKETIQFLENLNIPATFFINTAYLKGDKCKWTDVVNLADFCENPLHNLSTIKAGSEILNLKCNPEEYDYYRKIIEHHCNDLNLKNLLYLNREELFSFTNSLFTFGLHGHEHEHHTQMSSEWCLKNIEENFSQLKNHPNFHKFIAFPFGAFNKDEADYWEALGFKTFGCNGGMNYKDSIPLKRIPVDGKVVSFNLLAKLSGERFSFKKMFMLKK